MDCNDVLQLGGVAIALILCVVWGVRRILHRGNPTSCGGENTECEGCSLAEHCIKSRRNNGQSFKK